MYTCKCSLWNCLPSWPKQESAQHFLLVPTWPFISSCFVLIFLLSVMSSLEACLSFSQACSSSCWEMCWVPYPDPRTRCCSPLRAATEKGLAWWFPWTDQLSQKLFKWNISVKESLTGTELLLIDLLLRKHRRNMLNMKGKDLMFT